MSYIGNKNIDGGDYSGYDENPVEYEHDNPACYGYDENNYALKVENDWLMNTINRKNAANGADADKIWRGNDDNENFI